MSILKKLFIAKTEEFFLLCGVCTLCYSSLWQFEIFAWLSHMVFVLLCRLRSRSSWGLRIRSFLLHSVKVRSIFTGINPLQFPSFLGKK